MSTSVRGSGPAQEQVACRRARHRLLSIHHDIHRFQVTHQAWLTQLKTAEEVCDDGNSAPFTSPKSWPIVPNERCGTWYTAPTLSDTTRRRGDIYFKSTDGHANVWNFSLKRLNLPLLQVLHQFGGCFLVDSSARKPLPDSFTRTLPIWATVLNRMAHRLRTDMQQEDARDLGSECACGHDNKGNDTDDWDMSLHTPPWLISAEEHEVMEQLLEERVDTLYESRAIVRPDHFLEHMTKPIRVVWMVTDETTGGCTTATVPFFEASWLDRYHIVCCCNPSLYHQECYGSSLSSSLPPQLGPTPPLDAISAIKKVGDKNATKASNKSGKNTNKNKRARKALSLLPPPLWMPDNQFYYTPGAADDQESWARGMTVQLFWKHGPDEMAQVCRDKTDDEVDAFVDSLVVASHEDELDNGSALGGDCHADQLGNLPLWIGSRRAGRPPECWDHFDAILNVTQTEYPDMMMAAQQNENNGSISGFDNNNNENTQISKFYLNLPVAEGKRDKFELEQWLPVGLAFLILHLQTGQRRVLIHCAQGKDRSVALALALVSVACPHPLTFPLQFMASLGDWNVADILHQASHVAGEKSDEFTENKCHGADAKYTYKTSGMSMELFRSLFSTEKEEYGGRERFLEWIHKQRQKGTKTGTHKWQQQQPSNPSPSSSNNGDCNEEAQSPPPLANKESLRIALHLIRQDREVAEPTRSTMQKLNRFFMSSPLYRDVNDNNEGSC